MTLRLTALLIVLTIFGCALLASYQHSDQPLRIDAKPGTWPANARYSLNQPNILICRPMVFTVGPDAPSPIVRT